VARTSPAAEAATTRSSERLRELAGHRFVTVRQAVAENDAAPDDVVIGLVEDANPVVRSAAATTGTARPGTHAALAASSDRWVRAILAHTAAAGARPPAYEIQRGLVEDSVAEVRERVAETTSFQDLFDRLLRDPSPRVRGICAANPRVTRDVVDRLLSDPSAVVRRLAVAGGIRYPDDGQLLRMASDRSVEVRWQVAIRPGAWRRALDVLSYDSDEIVRGHAVSRLRGEIVDEFAGLARRRAESVAGLRFDPSPTG
jgi:hypothetical protein